jgi:hypothetical protein
LNEQAEIHIMMLEFTPFHRFTLLQPPFDLIHTRHHSRDNLQRRSAHSNDSITEEEWTTLIQGYITQRNERSGLSSRVLPTWRNK